MSCNCTVLSKLLTDFMQRSLQMIRLLHLTASESMKLLAQPRQLNIWQSLTVWYVPAEKRTGLDAISRNWISKRTLKIVCNYVRLSVGFYLSLFPVFDHSVCLSVISVFDQSVIPLFDQSVCLSVGQLFQCLTIFLSLVPVFN